MFGDRSRLGRNLDLTQDTVNEAEAVTTLLAETMPFVAVNLMGW